RNYAEQLSISVLADRREEDLVKFSPNARRQRGVDHVVTQFCLRSRPNGAWSLHVAVGMDLSQWVFDEFRISVTKQILSRELRALGYRKLSARPRHHAHDEGAVAAFKKKVPDILATIAATSGKPLELWFQDEARIGQKKKVTRRWAERGTRPFALKDQRTASAYIFGHLSRARQGGRSRPPILQ